MPQLLHTQQILNVILKQLHKVKHKGIEKMEFSWRKRDTVIQYMTERIVHLLKELLCIIVVVLHPLSRGDLLNMASYLSTIVNVVRNTSIHNTITCEGKWGEVFFIL